MDGGKICRNMQRNANAICEIEERQRLNDSIKHHQRDRNRAPSEPAG